MEIYKLIKEFTDQDIHVFACSKDKAPATPNGHLNASNDFEVAKMQFFKEDLLIGMPMGQINGLICVDFDVNKPIPGTNEIDPRTVEELFEEVENNFGKLPETVSVETQNGGRHFYYLINENIDIRSKNRFLDKNLAVDLKAGGGYVIAPDGKSYIIYDDFNDLGVSDFKLRCAMCPQWLIDYKMQQTENQEQPLDNILPPEEIREIRSALAFMSSDDRDLWVRIGMALKSTGSPSAFGLWNEWSQNSSKYDGSEMESRWNTFHPKDITIASLFHDAKKFGWLTTYEQIQVSPENIEIIKKRHSKQPFPPELLKPPGLVGELMDYIESRSIKSQPIYSLAGAMTAVGSLFGRKIQTNTEIRTNIYTLSVGTSGSGKESCRSVIKKCFYEAGALEMIKVEDLASDAAISTALDGHASQLFLLDEIGRFLQTTNTAAAAKNTHLYNIITVLLKLYSNANSVYSGKSYADKDKQIIVQQPNLCIYGTTVPDTLYRGLTTQSLHDGFISRMLIFESDQPNPKKKRRRELNFIEKTPKSLIDSIAKIYNKPINHDPIGNIDERNAKPQLVSLTDNAIDMLEDFDDHIHELRDKLIAEGRPDNVYNRTSQMAEQIALIIAGGNNPDNPVISEMEISYGITMAHYLADNMMHIAENYIAENENEHAVKWILQKIRKAGRISLTELTLATQKLKGYERNDVIETLKKSGQVIEVLEGEGVNATKFLIST